MSKTIQFPDGKKGNNQENEDYLIRLSITQLAPLVLYWQSVLNGQCEDEKLQQLMEAAAAFGEKHESN